MRTEVKIGLVICVLIIGIIVASNLFSGGEDTSSTDAAPAGGSQATNEPATIETNPEPASPVRLTERAPDPVRPARSTPPAGTPGYGVSPPTARPTTPPLTPSTPGAAAAPSPRTPSTETSPGAIDFSALRPAANAPARVPATGNRFADAANTQPAPSGSAPVSLSGPATPSLPNLNERPATPSTPAAPAVKLAPSYYVVTADDDGGFYGIAKKVYGSPRYAYLIRNANQDAESTRLRPGQKLNIPKLPDEAVRLETNEDGMKIHVVKDGEVAWDIAKKYYGDGKYFYLIERANRDIDINVLHIGQKLRIPGKPNAAASTGADAAATGLTGRTLHTIAPDDTLSDISKARYGASRLWPAIKQANPGMDENYLIVGKKIVIPSKAEALKMVGLTEEQLQAGATPVSHGASDTTTSSAERGQYTQPRPMFE